MKTRHTPFVLIVRDGWGENPHREHDEFNAIRQARTPVADRLMREYPTTLIHTSGENVGVPEGTTGNSEVGHQNLGAGRIVDQDSVRITKAIRDGSFFENAALVEAVERVMEQVGTPRPCKGVETPSGAGGRGSGELDRVPGIESPLCKMHLMGIASDAGVHGLLEHLYACLELCRRRGLKREQICIHLFTDGRDTGPFTGIDFVEQVERRCDEIGVGRVVSIMGRYWAMDRDHRWERTRRAWDCLTGAGPESARFATAREAVQEYYDHPLSPNRKGDEFITPRIVGDEHDTRIAAGDSVIFYNYRGDRPRQLIRAFVMPEFYGHVKPSPDSGEQGFDRGATLPVHFVTMCEYDRDLNQWVNVGYPKPPPLKDIAGEYLAGLRLKQFRCAETEKYAHVTFFFNDYREEPFDGEHRTIIQSPRVSTYDEQPEMSAPGVCEAVLERLTADDCEEFIVVNFANPDMVGHTGNLDAAVKAVEVVDECVGRIVEAALKRGGCLIVTADHGNAEQMWDPQTNGPHTAHTPYDVPLIVVGEAFRDRRLREGGRLADVIPTAFEMIGIDTPHVMTGASLLK